MRNLKAIAIVAASFILPWILFAFLTLQINPLDWGINIKLLYTVGFAYVLVFGMLNWMPGREQ